ncbi:MAG: xanthine dehydrogenase family protein molybdopterin-binding subunit [Deltaproteobacteria bacterium]|nr:xanthine dehydrogenase family protein molybdopterin-binding subunit [Deltaproteobacteria bacterium]
MKVVGQELPRVEIFEKVTGESVFGADVRLAGPALVGKILGSPHAHARIKNIDTTKAERLAGVKAVVTAQDLPPVKYGRFVRDEEYFARSKVRLAGDRIAAVAAVDEETAEEALRLIKVDYEVLPPVTDALEAMREGAPLLHEEYAQYEALPMVEGRKGNICYHKETVQGDIERGFREADRVFEHRFYAPMVHQTYIEPHAVLARVDASGKVTVWVPTQAQFFIRQSVAEIFQLPLIKVKVIPTEIGGGFGGKLLPTIEPAAVALARKSGMPVQIVMTRAEDFQVANPRHPFHMRYKTGVKLDGTIVAREVELVLGTGAYCGIGIVTSQRAEMLGAGPYRIPNVKIDVFCVYTNHANCGPYRAPAGPQIAFASESQIDLIARELKLDPLEMRLKNAIEDGDTTPACGGPLKAVHAKETLLRAAEAAGWKTTSREKNRGRGIALGYWLVGGYASSAGVKLNEDGTVTVITGVVDLSGTVTSLGQIAAEVLGVELDDVHVRTADSDFAPHSTISAGSQALRSMGTAVKLAAEEVKKQIMEVAADKLEAEPGDLVAEGKRVYVRGSIEKGLSLERVAQLSLTHRRGPIASIQSTSQFPNQPAFSAHVADVEVDPQTGGVKVLRYVAAQDVGIAINPLSVRGQIQGSVIQGLGQALSEANIFKNGKMLNPTFLDYKIFSSLDAPPVEVHLVEHAAQDGPFGAKGIGEPSIIPVTAAIANAVCDAVGARVFALPASAENVLTAIQEKNKERKLS